MKIDKINKKILRALLQNSRIPLSQLAKVARTSREVATYRLKKLEQEGIIQRFITHIDLEKMGYHSAAIFLNIKVQKEKEFKEFLKESTHVFWSSEHTGIWNYGFGIVGKTHDEVHTIFSEICHLFKEHIINHRFTFLRKTNFYWEKIAQTKPTQKNATSQHKIDKIDKNILSLLCKNARIDYTELARSIALTAPAIKSRIKTMEETGIIKQYSIFVDISKLDLMQYSIFITNHNIAIKNKLIKYLNEHPKIVFTVEYLGDEFYEFGVVVKNPYELRPILQEIEEAFPDNRIKEYSLVQEDLVSIGPPSCVFD